MKLKKLAMALVAAGIFVDVGAGVKDVRAEVYTYPITPDDPEWANYNHAELVDMLQIPEDILDEMTDEELVESVLNYPYLGDMKFYDDYKVGVQIVRDTFNGLQKLLENENAINLLLNYYETSIYTNENTSEDIFESVKKDSTEMILSFMMEENVMSEDEENRFAALMTEETGDNSKAALDIGIEPLAEIPFTWKYDVKTPRGSVVKTKLYSYSAVNNSEERALIQALYPNVVIIGDATGYYNCHSFAWYSWDTANNKRWMPSPMKYWKDGSYKRGSKKENAIITYFSDYGEADSEYPNDKPAIHSGAIVITGEVMSKWGASCLVRHATYDCPYSYTYYPDLTIGYYEENK